MIDLRQNRVIGGEDQRSRFWPRPCSWVLRRCRFGNMQALGNAQPTTRSSVRERTAFALTASAPRGPVRERDATTELLLYISRLLR